MNGRGWLMAVAGVGGVLFAAGAVDAVRMPVALPVSGSHIAVNYDGFVKRGSVTLPLDQAGLFRSGDVVHWTITARNEGHTPVRPCVVVGSIARRGAYVPGSAYALNNAAVTYSLDGRFYSPQPTVPRIVGDFVVHAPAPPDTYKNVCFTWQKPIPAGHERSASYDMRIQ